jgi:hypothetical protein
MFPSSMNVTSDLCLAKLVDSELICVVREVIIRNNWVQMPLTESGTYAMIFNPDLNRKLGITQASDAQSTSVEIPLVTPTRSPLPTVLPDIGDEVPTPEDADELKCTTTHFWCRIEYLLYAIFVVAILIFLSMVTAVAIWFCYSKN